MIRGWRVCSVPIVVYFPSNIYKACQFSVYARGNVALANLNKCGWKICTFVRLIFELLHILGRNHQSLSHRSRHIERISSILLIVNQGTLRFHIERPFGNPPTALPLTHDEIFFELPQSCSTHQRLPLEHWATISAALTVRIEIRHRQR